jgi:hypothetical protein
MNTKFRILVIFSLVLFVVLSTKQLNACVPIIASTSTSTPTTVPAEKTVLRFIVYYSGDLSAVMKDEDSYMKTFMEVYNLKLISTFKIDETNSGFTLEAKEGIEFPTEVAREMSLINNILMIEVTHILVTEES